MSIRQERDWGWTEQAPAEVGFAWAAANSGVYVERQGLDRRDLGLAAVSGGALSVDRIRVPAGGDRAPWRRLTADFDFLYVLAGSARLENECGEDFSLAVGSAAVHPGGLAYRFVRASADFEAVHVTAPANPETVLIAELAATDGPSGAVITHDTDDQYVRGDGPRAYFLYRDLGTREPTDGRIHFHVVRATEPGPGTGWHYHTMAQWFMVIGGSAVIRVEDRPRYPLSWGDAMCVGRGPQMRHNVTGFSGDYKVLEMCIPAEYDTIVTDEPRDADAE
jgi:quercetin dioxygenase-like cupin family protein